MKKSYIVTAEFLDKYDNLKYCSVGTVHTPHNEERAKHLIDLGFLGEEVEDSEPTPEPSADGLDEDNVEGLIKHPGGIYELPNGDRVKGKAKALKALIELQGGGKADESGKSGPENNISE